MELKKNHKGDITHICSMRFKSSDKSVTFESNFWDGRKANYQIEICPFEYLNMAQDIMRKLRKMTGVEFGIAKRISRNDKTMINWY